VNIVLKYAAGGMASVDKYMEELGDNADDCVRDVFEYLQAVETAKKSHDEQEVARLVEKYRLMREHIPTWMMKSKEVFCFVRLKAIAYGADLCFTHDVFFNFFF